MFNYIVRRLLQAIPTVLGVLFIIFILFFTITSPQHMATRMLGEKARPQQIEQWIEEHGYHLPKFLNGGEEGVDKIRQTRFYQFFSGMLRFDFGKSDLDDISIGYKIRTGVGPSLAVTVPIFIVGSLLAILISLVVALFRENYIDRTVLVLCVIGMSVVYFLYIIGGQYYLARTLKWFPLSGWDSKHMISFLTLPWLIGIVNGLGANIRFYRTMMVNEISRDYIRTARAKGLRNRVILSKHLLKNAMIPILTSLVMSIPYLFIGSLLLETFFSIPGLGRLLVEAILNNDFRTTAAMVYISSLMYISFNLLTDISYTFVDPRVRLT